jgi:hypothetical protein
VLAEIRRRNIIGNCGCMGRASDVTVGFRQLMRAGFVVVTGCVHALFVLPSVWGSWASWTGLGLGAATWALLCTPAGLVASRPELPTTRRQLLKSLKTHPVFREYQRQLGAPLRYRRESGRRANEFVFYADLSTSRATIVFDVFTNRRAGFAVHALVAQPGQDDMARPTGD